jgi:hypothetical protein
MYLNRKLRLNFWGIVILCVFLCLLGSLAFAQQSLQVRTNQWLQVEQIQGVAVIKKGDRVNFAQVGNRLESQGDQISTGSDSSVTLLVDTGIGTVEIGENTILRIRSLQIAEDNGRITQLDVLQGRARMQVRRFTHFGSRFEMFTPSGVSGVRGTQFAVAVDPSGKTSLATLEGKVSSEALNRNVLVGAKQQNFTIKGEPPTAATVLNNDPQLSYEVIKEVNGLYREVRLSGKIDPTHLLSINGLAQSTDRSGHFSIPFPAASHVRVNVTVTTALGVKQVYEVTLL